MPCHRRFLQLAAMCASRRQAGGDCGQRRPTNRAPTLVKLSAPGVSVAAGQTVSVTVAAADPDGNLSNIDLNWNDGSAVVHRTVTGSSATVTFTRTFSTARTVSWSATAYDTVGTASNMLTGSFAVR
jgi:hypothetical protein